MNCKIRAPEVSHKTVFISWAIIIFLSNTQILVIIIKSLG